MKKRIDLSASGLPQQHFWNTTEYFKAQAGERGYQTLINETLRQAMQHEDLEERLRRIIREELHREAIPSAV